MLCAVREGNVQLIISEEQSDTGTAIGRGIKIGIGMPLFMYQIIQSMINRLWLHIVINDSAGSAKPAVIGKIKPGQRFNCGFAEYKRVKIGCKTTHGQSASFSCLQNWMLSG